MRDGRRPPAGRYAADAVGAVRGRAARATTSASPVVRCAQQATQIVPTPAKPRRRLRRCRQVELARADERAAVGDRDAHLTPAVADRRRSVPHGSDLWATPSVPARSSCAPQAIGPPPPYHEASAGRRAASAPRAVARRRPGSAVPRRPHAHRPAERRDRGRSRDRSAPARARARTGQRHPAAGTARAGARPGRPATRRARGRYQRAKRPVRNRRPLRASALIRAR